MEKETDGELDFFDTLLKRSNEKISVLVYRNPMHPVNTYTTVLTTKQVARKVLLPSCVIEHLP